MRNALILIAALGFAGSAMATDIGLVKVAKGSVQIQRGATKIPAAVGTALKTQDVVVTGSDGSAGITFTDNSLVSVGPNSVFAIAQYRFEWSSSRPTR
jgi:hypothetical protein